ncbi:MAG: MFS transporter [Woeseiaceae bacterium]
MQTQSRGESATMLSSEKRVVGVAALIAMLRMFGLFALLPVLSLYAASLEGATPMLIGLAVGAYGLTQAGLQIPLGMLSDRIGRRPVIIGGLFVFAIGSIVAAMGDTIHTVIAGRLLQGGGAISATLAAMIADATREQVRTRSMAVFGIGIGLSFVIALIVGPAIAAYSGVSSLFWIGALLAVLGAALMGLIPADIERPVAAHAWNIRPALRSELLRLDFYVFLLHAILTATFVALPFLFTNTLGLPVTAHWKVYVGALFVSLLGTVPLILRDERQGKSATLGVAVLLLLAGLLVLAFAAFAVTPVFIALALFFAGFNFLEAGLPARLSILSDGHARGASLGVFSSSQFLGAFVGGLIGGRFLGAERPADVFIVCALLAGIWLAASGFKKETGEK